MDDWVEKMARCDTAYLSLSTSCFLLHMMGKQICKILTEVLSFKPGRNSLTWSPQDNVSERLDKRHERKYCRAVDVHGIITPSIVNLDKVAQALIASNREPMAACGTRTSHSARLCKEFEPNKMLMMALMTDKHSCSRISPEASSSVFSLRSGRVTFKCSSFGPDTKASRTR